MVRKKSRTMANIIAASLENIESSPVSEHFLPAELINLYYIIIRQYLSGSV